MAEQAYDCGHKKKIVVAQQKVYDCGHKENMVVAGQKVYMATKGIWSWPNRRCMLVVTKRILWPNIRWMDDCGHCRRMVLATHEAYDHDLTQGVLSWPNKVYDCGHTRGIWSWPHTSSKIVSTLGIWLWPHKVCDYG